MHTKRTELRCYRKVRSHKRVYKDGADHRLFKVELIYGQCILAESVEGRGVHPSRENFGRASKVGVVRYCLMFMQAESQK